MDALTELSTALLRDLAAEILEELRTDEVQRMADPDGGNLSQRVRVHDRAQRLQWARPGGAEELSAQVRAGDGARWLSRSDTLTRAVAALADRTTGDQREFLAAVPQASEQQPALENVFDGAVEEHFLTLRRGNGGQIAALGPGAGRQTEALRGGAVLTDFTSATPEQGDRRRENRQVRRDAEAISACLRRDSRRYDTGFVHY